MTTRIESTNKRDIVRACVNVDLRERERAKKIENNINDNNNRKEERERKIQSVEKRNARRQTNNRRKREILCLYRFKLENRR